MTTLKAAIEETSVGYLFEPTPDPEEIDLLEEIHDAPMISEPHYFFSSYSSHLSSSALIRDHSET